jgi:hypothetical protein
MENETNKTPSFVRLELTKEQKAQVRNSIGRDADAIELSARELEERIAPMIQLRDEG